MYINCCIYYTSILFCWKRYPNLTNLTEGGIKSGWDPKLKALTRDPKTPGLPKPPHKLTCSNNSHCAGSNMTCAPCILFSVYNYTRLKIRIPLTRRNVWSLCIPSESKKKWKWKVESSKCHMKALQSNWSCKEGINACLWALKVWTVVHVLVLWIKTSTVAGKGWIWHFWTSIWLHHHLTKGNKPLVHSDTHSLVICISVLKFW